MFALPCERFGAYELSHKLGKGGMGEVWRATHMELRCERALKFPLPHIAANRRWRAELLREARILVTLEHRNIATLFDFLDHEGRFAIVMEYVPGRTLAEVLREGPMPLRDAVVIMRQVGEALHYAHSLERPVIHRDLKPGNVMVRPDGVVKVLDWGLALAELESGGAAETSRAAAGGGPILGTPGYMAPEQVRGKLADARADIWAFGCILYECLTGRRAFPCAVDDLNATLTDQPDWSALPASVPKRMRGLIERTLQKEPRDRLQSIDIVLRELVDDDQSLHQLPGDGHAPTNLVPSLTSFVGRVRELHRIRQLLAQPHIRLLTLTGFGGCGKTRLALRIAEDVTALQPPDDRSGHLPYPDGVWIVELASIADAALIPQAIAAALPGGLQPEIAADPRRGVIDKLRGMTALLVLDNCEHLVAACRDLVHVLLRQCPNLRILATSREPLGVAGEQHFDIHPLATPVSAGGDDPAMIRRCEAAELFVRRAQLVLPDFELTDENAAAVADICRRLDGIPLAIELAAARVRTLSLDQIRARLDHVFDFLKRALPGGTRRHATLEATIKWSCDMLDASQRSLLDQLLVFQGGWTLEAAEAVGRIDDDPQGRDVAELLSELVEKSLVVFEQVNGWPRYRFLETVRQFCLKAVEGGEAVSQTVRQRHAGFFLQFAERADAQLSGPERATWLERVGNDNDNFRAALDWSLRFDADPSIGLRLSTALRWFWYIRGYHQEGRQWLEAAIAKCPSAYDTLRLAALNTLGMLTWRADGAAAQSFYRQALAIATALGDKPRIAAILNNIGVLAREQGDFALSRHSYEQSAAIYHELNNAAKTAEVQLNAGALALEEGRLDEARQLLQSSLPFFVQAKDELRIAVTMRNLGEADFREGRFEQAFEAFMKSLSLRRKLGDPKGVVEACRWLAMLAAGTHHFECAAALFGYAETYSKGKDLRIETPAESVYLDMASRASEELGSDSFETACVRGRALTEQGILEELALIGAQSFGALNDSMSG